jgi:D-galactarolactone cycloisomerase
VKIKDVTPFVLRTPEADEPFFSSQMSFASRKALLVRVRTEDGLVGWGEGGQWGPAEPVASAIEHVLAPRIIGADALRPTRIWEELYAYSRDFGQKGTYVEALSAIDLALWDICGKAADRPVHALLGGAFRDRVPVYATGGFYRESYDDDAAELRRLRSEVEGFAGQGYEIVKIKLGLRPVGRDAERVAVVREVLGDRGLILVDANHAYDASTAIRLGRSIEHLDIGWFEEPVVPEDRRGYRRVREALSIPIAGGEAEFTRFGFRDLIGDGCVDIVQPDLCGSGGFSEFLKIHALASAFGVRLVPHVWGSAVAVAAAAQALAILPPSPHTYDPVALQNLPVGELDRSPNPLREEIVENPVRVEAGVLHIPQGPGLGVVVDEAAVMRFTAGAR